MKSAGIIVLVLGLLMLIAGVGMFVGSFFVIGSSVKSAMESRVAGTLPLKVEESVTSEPMAVDSQHRCQIVFQADLSGTSVKRDNQGGNPSYHLDYNLPFECEVFDETGKRIHRESSTLSGGGLRMWFNSSVDEDGGSETVRMLLGTFPAPASGKLSVTAKVGANSGGDVQIESAQVDVLDNVTTSGATAAGGLGMCCGGPAVAMIGLVMLIVGAVMSLTSRSNQHM
jgi:hypothetical protein